MNERMNRGGSCDSLRSRRMTGGAASRSIYAVVSLLVTVLGLGAGVTAAQAAPLAAAAFPSGPFSIEVHKYEQPANLGDPATGLPIDPAVVIGTDPVPGAEFSATRVPGIDLSTNAGQRDAAALTPQEAAQRIAGETPETSAVTDANGNASLSPLPMGLYYVQETVVPTGFVASAPFLVALPLTAPEGRDGWLGTVHVYPKNAKVGIELTVNDEHAVKLGDTVRWRSASDIPGGNDSIETYTVRNLLADHVRLQGRLSDIEVRIEGQPAGTLQEGRDYRIVEVTGPDGRWGFDVEFTAEGREVLEAHRGSRVTVAYDTVVDAEGEHSNTAQLFTGTGGGASTMSTSDDATTKWGPLEIIVHEVGHPSNRIPGAKFKLYLTAEDALHDRNAIEVDGVNEWTTDAEGRIIINGLRFSDFVNGLQRERGETLFREYFVMLTHVPDGWRGTSNPIALTVTSATDPETALVEVWRESGVDTGSDSDADSGASPAANANSSASGSADAKGGGGGLSETGAQLAGAALITVLLVVGGVVLVLRRREREAV